MSRLRPLKILLVVQAIFFFFLALSFIVTSGNLYCTNSCSLSIANWHMHDALWHISLAKLGFVSWPLQNPFLAGESLNSYNFLLDFFLWILLKAGLSPFFAFFKLLPLVAVSLYIWSVLAYLKTRGADLIRSNLLAFFLFFGNSFTYLATLYKDRTFNYATLRGFPVVSSIQPSTMTLNLQYAFSLSIILWLLIILAKPRFPSRPFVLSILFLLLFGLKFYGGVVGLLILGFHYLFTTRHKQSFLDLLAVFFGSLLGLYIFYGLSTQSGFPFTWAPFALTHLLIDDPLLFYNHSWTLARYYLYENLHGVSLRLVFIEGVSIILFLLINFGTRIFAGLQLISALLKKKLLPLQIVLSLVILITILIPIFFVQDGGWYNTMQFLYYGVWLSGILMADYCFDLIHSKLNFKYLLLFLIIALTIPNDIEQLRYLKVEQNIVSSDELSAMSVLKNSPPGIVHIFDSEHKYALVPALAEKSVYYLDTDQLMVTHAPYQDRLAFMNKYSGGSITTVPANYYLIYKKEWGTEDAIRALTSPSQYELIYDSDNLALYHKL